MIIFAGFVIGCGNSPIPVRDLPGDFRNAECAQEVTCLDSPDTETCDATTGEETDETDTVFADVDSGVIKYNAGAAQACLDLIHSSCTFTGFHTAPNPNPCDEILTGTIAQGGACVIDQECAESAHCTQTDTTCDRNTACCPGTCGAPMPIMPPVAIGASCGQGQNCVNAAYCKQGATSGSGTCTALISGVGTACDQFDACVNPLYCSSGGSGTSGMCKAAAATGATCSTNDEISCGDSRDYCDTTTMKCTRHAAVGATCSDTVPCVNFAQCTNAVCVANPKLGDACNATGGPSCPGTSSCTNGTCQVPTTTAMSCK